MKLSFAFLSNMARSYEDGRLDAFGLFNTASAKTFPHFFDRAFLTVGLCLTKKEAMTDSVVYIEFAGPDGKILFTDSQPIPALKSPPHDDNQITAIFQFSPGLPAYGLGRHEFRVFAGGAAITTVPLRILSSGGNYEES